MNAQQKFQELLAKGVPVHLAGDMARAFAIPEEKRCERCDGTGNELFSMYKECQACKGDGISRGNEKDFTD